MANLNQSFAEPQALINGIGNLSALLDAFTDTIFQTSWYFKTWTGPYSGRSAQGGHTTPTRSRQGFDSFAQKVISTVYQPNIQEIADANPAFSSGQQVKVNNRDTAAAVADHDGLRRRRQPPPPTLRTSTSSDLRRRPRLTGGLQGGRPPPPADPGGPPPPPNLNDPNLDGVGGPNGPNGLNLPNLLSGAGGDLSTGSGWVRDCQTSSGAQTATVQTKTSTHRNCRADRTRTSTHATGRFGRKLRSIAAAGGRTRTSTLCRRAVRTKASIRRSYRADRAGANRPEWRWLA